MPYKYIGRTCDLKGKSLWEIVGNLKNFGVGRIVARNRWDRYPEPSYMKILRVETLPTPQAVSPDNVRKVQVLVEKTFRGKTDPQPVLINSTSYKPDYRLLAKDEEEEFCKIEQQSATSEKILPRTGEFPPLLKELIIREIKAGGKDLVSEPQLDLVYNKRSMKKKYRIAKDGEQPNVSIPVGLGTPISPNLYNGIELK